VHPRLLARQLYVDLVRTRSRVRIVAASEPRLDVTPIFIIGLYRSGTTLLRYLIDSHSKIACPPETDFIHLLEPLLLDFRAQEGFNSIGINRDHLIARLQHFISYFYENYAKSCGKLRWADKSPLYVDHLQTLRTIYPTAAFVILHRHPLDQIHSHARAGRNAHAPLLQYQSVGEDLRLAAARYWVDKTQKILDFAKSSPNSRQLTYEQLCAEPEKTMRGICDFLGAPWEPGVLQFWRMNHDVGMEAASARRSTGFAPRSGEFAEWDGDTLRKCKRIVRPTATLLGYEVD